MQMPLPFAPHPRENRRMQMHASCAAQDGAGVLLTGPPGSGKSDLLLRLIQSGFSLVADDRVELEDDLARAPEALAGLIEVRGLGIIRLPYLASARLAIVVALDRGDRLPLPETRHGLPLVHIDPALPSAPARVTAALHCATGRTPMLAGAFA